MTSAGGTQATATAVERSPLHPGLFALLLGLFFMGLTDVQVVPVLLPAFEQTFAISIATAGSLVTWYSLAAAISALVVGPLSDHYGRLLFIRAAAGLFSLAAVLAAMAHGFGWLALARVLAGLAGGVFSACIVAYIADRFTFERRGRAMGWVAGMYSLSAVAGVPAGAYLSATLGWPAIFWGFGGLSLLFALGLPAGKAHPDAPVSRRFSAPGGFLQRQLQQYAAFWKKPLPRRGLWLAIGVVSATTSLITYLAAWLVDDRGFSMNEVSGIFLLLGGAMVIGSVAGGWLADRLGKIVLLAVWSGLLVPLLLAVGLLESKRHVLWFCLAGGLLLSLRESPYQAIITELVPADQRGAYLAMRSTVAKLAIAGSALLAGHLFAHFGFNAVAGFAALSSLAVCVGVVGLRFSTATPETTGSSSSAEIKS